MPESETKPASPSHGKLTYGRRDPVTGERWVYVSREAAHAHPMGRMHWSFLLVAAWLVLTAIVNFRAGQAFGGVSTGLAAAFLPLFLAILILLRAPIARPLMIALGLFSIFTAVKGIRGWAGPEVLFMTIVTLGVTFWMWEGVRPNLAFGYRFKSLPKDGKPE